MLELIQDLTVLSAIIAALAAIIAPALTAIITQRGGYKEKAAEMFFMSKVNAYSDFLAMAAEYGDPSGVPEIEKSRRLQSASARALLFSSPKTQDKIGRYGQLLMKNSFHPDDIQELALANRDMILAMQKELRKYEK